MRSEGSFQKEVHSCELYPNEQPALSEGIHVPRANSPVLCNEGELHSASFTK